MLGFEIRSSYLPGPNHLMDPRQWQEPTNVIKSNNILGLSFEKKSTFKIKSFILKINEFVSHHVPKEQANVVLIDNCFVTKVSL